MARWLVLLLLAAVGAGGAAAVRCYESLCEPSEEQFCRLDDGLDRLAECHYANFLESLRHLQEHGERPRQHGAGSPDDDFRGPVVTADRMWCAKVVGTASGRTQVVYRACVPRDGERCRELMQLVTDRLRRDHVGPHLQVHVNCSRCSTDACNGSAGSRLAAGTSTLLLLLLLTSFLPAAVDAAAAA